MGAKSRQKSIVSAEIRFLSNLVFHAQSFWKTMGNLEYTVYRDILDPIPISRPIFITGLARSGTTILLEMLYAHPETASSVYRDFPLLYTPCGWNRFIQLAGGSAENTFLEERTHKDGIQIGPNSPEAMEEPLWMHFFSHLHDPDFVHVLDARTSCPAFETFYRNHIRKILHVRGGSRYLSKGNYNLARMEYLLNLFPDVRFVIPVRDPVSHIASLRKQQRLFEKLERDDPPVLKHMSRAGHFEFGLNWTPVNYGHTQTTKQIIDAWNAGHDVEAWALYWADTHRYLVERIQKNSTLEKSVLIVPYELLCSDSDPWISTVFSHCQLEPEPGLFDEYSGKLRQPDYYQPDFSAQEREIIRDITTDTAIRVGLPVSSEK